MFRWGSLSPAAMQGAEQTGQGGTFSILTQIQIRILMSGQKFFDCGRPKVSKV